MLWKKYKKVQNCEKKYKKVQKKAEKKAKNAEKKAKKKNRDGDTSAAPSIFQKKVVLLRGMDRIPLGSSISDPKTRGFPVPIIEIPRGIRPITRR